MCVCCLFQVMYARAVWMEDGKEMEGTIPNNWIDRGNRTIRWPNSRETQAYKMKKDPQDDWLTFQLVKIKMTSGRFCFWIIYSILQVKMVESIELNCITSS